MEKAKLADLQMEYTVLGPSKGEWTLWCHTLSDDLKHPLTRLENYKIIEEDKHVGLEYPGDEALPVTASRDL